jgi:hypothetical protein
MKQSRNFFNVFRQTISDRLSVSIVYFVLAVISSPLLQYVNNINAYYNVDKSYTANQIKSIKIVSGITTVESSLTIVVMVFSAIIAFMSFSYLHKKRSMDFYGSMPVTRRTEFFARMAATATVIIVPLIFVILGSAVISGFTTTIASMLAIMAMLIVAVIANIAFVGFLSVCCGTTGLTVLSYIIISFVYPIGVLIFSLFPQGVLTGLASWSINGILFTLLSPITAPYAVYDLVINVNVDTFNAGMVVSNVGLYLAWWGVFIVVVSLLNGWLVKKRKTESAQSGFAFVAPRIVIKVVTVITAGFLGGIIFALIGGLGDFSKVTSVVSFVLGYVFIAFAAHLLLHLMYHKGMNEFGKCLFLLIPEFIIGLLYYFIIMTGGFGFIARVPDVDNVEKAVISFSDSSFIVNGKDINKIEITDKDDLQLVVDSHKKIVDTIENKRTLFYGFEYDDNGYFDSINEYNITYTLKNGTTLTRSYDDYGLLSCLNDSDYIEKLYKKTDSDNFLNIPNSYCSNIYFEFNGDNPFDSTGEYDGYNFNNYENSDYLLESGNETESEFTLELLKALKDDYKEVGDISDTVDKNSILVTITYSTQDSNSLFSGENSYEKNINIDSRYTRTFKLLNRSEVQDIGGEYAE